MLKKIIALMLFAVLLIAALLLTFRVTSAEETPSDDQAALIQEYESLKDGTSTGGWITVEEDGPDDIEDRAEAALEKALKGLVGARYEEAEVLAYQVVAGMNYCILCRITPVVPDPVSHWALVYVYEALDGHCELLEVQDLEIGLSPIAE